MATEKTADDQAGKPAATVVPLARKIPRTGRGSLAESLELSEDWDSTEVNESIGRDFGLVTPIRLA